MVLHNGGAQPYSFLFISALGPPRSPVPRCSHTYSLAKNYLTFNKKGKIIIIATLNHCPSATNHCSYTWEGRSWWGRWASPPVVRSSPWKSQGYIIQKMTQSLLLLVKPQAVVTRQRSMPASSILWRAHNGEMILSRATSKKPHWLFPQNRVRRKKKTTCAFFRQQKTLPITSNIVTSKQPSYTRTSKYSPGLCLLIAQALLRCHTMGSPL